jgi:phosphate transport system protein
MTLHMQRDLEELKKTFLSLGTLVEENVQRSWRALETQDQQEVARVHENDDAIDRMEVAVEEACLKVLALHQPVAHDLRMVVTVLKSNNDLERIGDQAVNISNKADRIKGMDLGAVGVDFGEFFKLARWMLTNALDALVNADPRLARQVCSSDDQLNNMKKQVRDHVLEALQAHPKQAGQLIAVLGVARNLERIGDLATNIAEDAVYMIQGDIVRHQGEL